jgi:hypothetical protein
MQRYRELRAVLAGLSSNEERDLVLNEMDDLWADMDDDEHLQLELEGESD